MAASIGDFFVKIGLKIDNLQKLNSLTTRLDNASVAANNLVKNLNKRNSYSKNTLKQYF